MEARVKLGRIWGIPIGLHTSWFLIFGLVTLSLAVGYFPNEYAELPELSYWVLAAITSVLFFASVLLHELAHARLALRNRVPVRGITLFIFGGVAEIQQEPRSAGAEFRIAIAGPIMSLFLAIVFGMVWVLDRQIPYLAAPGMWLARINFMLAAFNMIPGFPLDGGRVLRAVVWKLSGSMYKATRVAATSGQLVAFGFMGLGLFSMLFGGLFDGLWLIFIGWFLHSAAAASLRQSEVQEKLQDMTVAQVMNHSWPQIPGQLSLREIVDGQTLSSGWRSFFVNDNGHVNGMLTLRDVLAVPQGLWTQVTARQVMTPWERLLRIGPATELTTALQLMERANVPTAPVVEGDRMIGVLSRDQVMRYLHLRSEMGI